MESITCTTITQMQMAVLHIGVEQNSEAQRPVISMYHQAYHHHDLFCIVQMQTTVLRIILYVNSVAMSSVVYHYVSSCVSPP